MASIACVFYDGVDGECGAEATSFWLGLKDNAVFANCDEHRSDPKDPVDTNGGDDPIREITRGEYLKRKKVSR